MTCNLILEGIFLVVADGAADDNGILFFGRIGKEMRPCAW